MCQLPTRGSTASTAATARARDQGSGSSSRPVAGRRARLCSSAAGSTRRSWSTPTSCGTRPRSCWHVSASRPRPTCSWLSAVAVAPGRRSPGPSTMPVRRWSTSTRPRPRELLGPAAESLAAAGFEVLWPAELTRSSLELRAVVATPAPASVVAAGLNLDALVRVPLAGHRRRRGAHRGRARPRWRKRNVR